MVSIRGCAGLLIAVVLAGCDGSDDSPPDADGSLDGAIDGGPHGCVVDGDCDDGLFCSGAEACDPDDPASDERGCVLAAAPCAATETCAEEADACVVAGCEDPDADGDGHDSIACGGTDCDDADPLRFPGSSEVCDTDDRDEDCDPTTFGFRDNDGDEYPDAACCNTDLSGGSFCGDDCVDASPAINPGEADTCDDRDNDCDGAVDEDGSVLYLDCDGDGFGNSAVSRMGCPVPVTASSDCPSPLPSSTWTATPGDCDDTRTSTHPGATDTCNGIDDDCVLPTDPPTCLCTEGETTRCGYDTSCEEVMGSCVGGAFACPPGLRTGGEAELCDGVDNNCDGTVDEGCPCGPVGSTRSCASEGRVGECASGTERCDPTGWTGCPQPATETCSSTDEDCDGDVDEEMHLWAAHVASPCASDEWNNSVGCPQSIAIACRAQTPPSEQCDAPGGYGPVEVTAGAILIVCTDAPRQLFVPGASLRMHHTGCEATDAAYNACRSAINGYCRADGNAGGYGWNDGSDTWSIQCLSNAQAELLPAPWSELTAVQSSCTGPSPHPLFCPNAAHRWCRDRGFASGHGPIDFTASGTSVLCIRDF